MIFLDSRLCVLTCLLIKLHAYNPSMYVHVELRCGQSQHDYILFHKMTVVRKFRVACKLALLHRLAGA